MRVALPLAHASRANPLAPHFDSCPRPYTSLKFPIASPRVAGLVKMTKEGMDRLVADVQHAGNSHHVPYLKQELAWSLKDCE